MMQDDIIRLIVIEESANDAEVILNSLRKARFPIRPKHVEDEEDLQDALTEHEWDLLISVPQVGEFTVAEACDIINNSRQDIPIIGLVEQINDKLMGELFQAGVTRVIPSKNDTCLREAVSRELENLAERRKRKHLEQLYKETQRHNKMLLETSRDAIAYVHDGMHIYANPSYCEMFGYRNMDELEGLPIMDLVALDDQAKFKEFMREFMTDEKEEEKQIDLDGLKSNNKRFKLKMEFSQAIYDSERCVQVIIRDQSQNQELEQKLKEASRRDQLTGLFNRQYFLTLLEKALAKAMETNTRSVLLYIALDNFISLRDTLGIGGSDPVIKNIGKVLQKNVDSGYLARFGDNVFTLLIMDKDVKFASELATKLCKTVEDSVTDVGNQSIITTCSIGIAILLAASGSPQDVLSDAHTACKVAQKSGGSTHEVYKAVVKGGEQGGMKIADIAKMIETAKEENRLSLRFQPIVSLHGDTQAIYEVLLRMVDAEGQAVPTGKLFTAAEQAGLSTALDKWVLEEAAKLLQEQKKQGQETHFFLKLSDQAVKDETIPLFIRKLLKTMQLPGDSFIIEISESMAISQIKLAKAFITTLKNFNCKSALEHFGTGLNSATTLKHVPIDFVKVDSSFSKDLSSNEESQQTVKDIVKLAHELNISVIAEAVEDANSLTVLWQCEVDFAQGHYIQEPLEDLAYDFSDEE